MPPRLLRGQLLSMTVINQLWAMNVVNQFQPMTVVRQKRNNRRSNRRRLASELARVRFPYQATCG
jgi:hypothetical protein